MKSVTEDFIEETLYQTIQIDKLNNAKLGLADDDDQRFHSSGKQIQERFGLAFRRKNKKNSSIRHPPAGKDPRFPFRHDEPYNFMISLGELKGKQKSDATFLNAIANTHLADILKANLHALRDEDQSDESIAECLVIGQSLVYRQYQNPTEGYEP